MFVPSHIGLFTRSNLLTCLIIQSNHPIVLYAYYSTSIGFNLSIESVSGPQRDIPVLRLWNVRSCGIGGPAVPIQLSASTDARIILYQNGSIEREGNISMWPLQCHDCHTQMYGVCVPSTEDFTLTAEILNAPLPKQCITVSSKHAACICYLLPIGNILFFIVTK